jgi:RHS repeat-associated protein
MLTSQALEQGIDPFTGQVAFNLALVNRPGRNGLGTVLSAACSSAVRRTATTWNQQAPTGVLGLGWSLALDRVWVEPGPSALRADRDVYLSLGGQVSRLVRTGTAADGSGTYGCENGVFWQISYDPARETWRVVDENAVTYLFGDALSGRGTVDWGVAWGGWAGPSGQRAGQGAVAVGWSLSAVTDRFGDRVVYAYLQDGSTVGAGGAGYTQATCLASITGVDGATVRLTYQPKDAAEYQDPHTDPPPPNAWQDRFETRYLARVDTVSAAGEALDSIVLGYAAQPLGSGALTKRLLTSITRLSGAGAQVEPPLLFSYWGQATADGVSASQPFDAANGALYGAIRQATLAYGGTVAWTYAAPTLQYSARSLAVASTSTATAPRLYFTDDDYVLATWQDGAGTLRLQAYAWSGRWIRTEVAELTLPEGASYAGVQVGWGRDCCAILAGTSLLLAARDLFNPGGWLTPLTATVALGEGEQGTLAVGRDFACVLGGTSGTLYPYRLTGATWTADPTQSAGAAGSGFALAAHGALAVAVAAGASGGATGVTLLLRGTDGAWTKTAAMVDLGGLAGPAAVWMSAGFAVVRAAQSAAGTQTARYGALWWDGTATAVQGAAWLTASVPSGSTPAAPSIAGATVGLMGRLYRFGGAAWDAFDPGTVREPGATGMVSAGLGADLYARLFSTASGQAADLLAYDPLAGGWAVPAGLSLAGAAPLAAVAPRTADGAVGSYAAVGTRLWHRAADGSWSAVLTLPTGLNAADVATLTVLDDSVLLVQQGTGGSSPATLAYPLANGGAAAAAVSLAGEQFTPGTGGIPALAGTAAFATFTGSYGASGSTLTLYRALTGDVRGTQTGYAVASVTSDNQYGSTTGSGAVPRAVACNGTGATVDGSGYLPKFNQSTVIPGVAGGTATPNGSIVHGYYNGLVTGETPAQPFPDGTYTNALSYGAAAQGLGFVTLTRDASGSTAASNQVFWQVTAGVLGQAGRTAYARDVRREDLLDGVTTLSTTTYSTDTGFPATVATQAANAAGTVDAFAAQLTYWWQIYDPSRTTNLIAPVVQTTRTSTPAGGTEATVGVTVQTWRGDWGHGAGRWAPDRTFRALGASAPAFDAWQPADPAPAGWLMDGRVLATTPQGLPLAAQDALGRVSVLTYDASLTWTVASAGNCPADPTMLAWFGCEPYEQSGAWGTGDPSRSIWSLATTEDCHTGSQCLALPPGTAAGGPLLAVVPTDQARQYVFSCWARTPAAFAPANGVAQWTLQPFDPANGQAVGQPVTLVLTPADGTPTAVGAWEYFQATLDLPALVSASGKPALGVRVSASNANTSALVYLDELRLMPLDASLRVQVYDAPRWRPQAVVNSAGQSRQVRYDPADRPLVAIGPYDRVDRLQAWGYSRLLTPSGTFQAGFPNTRLQLSTSGGSRYYDFHDGNPADWTFGGDGWTIAGGELSYAGTGGTGIGATATLTAYAYTYFAAGVRIASVPAAGQTLALGNGDVYMQWVQGTGWKLVRVSGTTVTELQANASLPFGTQWTFAAIDGWILCFVDAAQLFAYQVTLPSPLPAGYGSVRLATSAAASWDDVVLLDSPQLRLDCLDGLGVAQQTLDFVGVQPAGGSSPYAGDAVVMARGPLLDGLGRPAGERMALQAPVQMSALPGSTGWELVQAGEADYLRTESGTALTMQQYLGGTGGYTYAGATYEASPLSRLAATVAPRPQGSDAGPYTTSLAYGGSATVGGGAVTTGARYRIATATRVQGTDGEGAVRQVMRRTTRDALGRVLMEEDGPVGGTLLQTGYAYDAAGRLSTVYRPNWYAPPDGSTADAWKETLTYDFLGRPASRHATDSGTTQRMYDSAGRLRFALDAAGGALTPPRILYRKYDGLDRLTESGYVQDARYGWNTALQAKADTGAFPVIVATPSGPDDATGAWGRRTAWDTDGTVSTRFLVGRVASISINQNGTAAPDVEHYQYDAYGNPVGKTVVMPGVSPTAGWTVQATWNGRDALASLTYPALDSGAPAVVMGYDRTGRLATVGTGAGEGPIVDPGDPPTPPEERWARYAYDPFGRVSGISYNNPVGEQDGPAVPRTYGYDGAQRLAGIADPYFVEALAYDGGAGIGGWSYYDGHVAQAQSAYLPGPGWSPAIRGMTQKFQYDGHGRLASAVSTLGDAFSVAPGGTVTYDANGNVRGTAHGRTQVSYAFAGANDLATNQVASAASTVSAPVDFSALTPGTAASGGWTWGSSNGGPSATALVATTSGPTTQVTQVLRLGGGGLGHYEVLRLATWLQPGAAYTVTWQAKTDAGYGQAIGGAAWYAVLAVESGPSVAVPLQALAATSGWQSGTVTVDPAALARSLGGGRTPVAVTVELRNQGRNADGSPGPAVYLAQAGVAGSVTGGTYQYDGDGSVIAAPDRGLSTLAYDPVTRLTTSITLAGGGSLAYAYGGDGRRSRASLTSGGSTGTTVTLTGFGGEVLATKDAAGAAAYYLNGPEGAFGMLSGSRLRLLLGDHLGSLRLAVDGPTGTVVSAGDYQPYGGGQRRTAPTGTDFGFTDQRLDAATGLYNYNARLYDPALGRFYGTDPAGEYASPYLYVGNDPLGFTDPDGRWAIPLTLARMRFGLGAAYTLVYAGLGAGLAAGAGGVVRHFWPDLEDRVPSVTGFAEWGAVGGAALGLLVGVGQVVAGVTRRRSTGDYPLIVYNQFQESGIFGSGIAGAQVIAEAYGIPASQWGTYLVPFQSIGTAALAGLARFTGEVVLVAHGDGGGGDNVEIGAGVNGYNSWEDAGFVWDLVRASGVVANTLTLSICLAGTSGFAAALREASGLTVRHGTNNVTPIAPWRNMGNILEITNSFLWYGSLVFPFLPGHPGLRDLPPAS